MLKSTNEAMGVVHTSWLLRKVYYFVALVYLLMALFTLYRISVRPPIDIEEQSEAMAVVMQTSQVIVAEAMDETDQGNPLAPERQEEEQPAAPQA